MSRISVIIRILLMLLLAVQLVALPSHCSCGTGKCGSTQTKQVSVVKETAGGCCCAHKAEVKAEESSDCCGGGHQKEKDAADNCCSHSAKNTANTKSNSHAASGCNKCTCIGINTPVVLTQNLIVAEPNLVSHEKYVVTVDYPLGFTQALIIPPIATC